MSIEYLAGFFDGEGCISVGARNNPHLQIVLCQVNPAPLRLFADRFGGKVTKVNKLPSLSNLTKLQGWRVVLSSQCAANALREMLPYLIVKKGEAELAIAMQALVLPPGRPRGGKCDPWLRAERQSYAEAITLAKRFAYNEDGSVV